MTKLPSELLHKFLTGENHKRHCNELMNSICSNMVIQMIFMGYCHVPACMIGINFNNSALESWARNLHVLSVLEQNLLGLNGNETNKNVIHSKGESRAQMKVDSCLCRCSSARNSPHTFTKALNQRNKRGLLQNCRGKAIVAVHK